MFYRKATRRTFIRQYGRLTAALAGGGVLLPRCVSKDTESGSKAKPTSANPCQDLDGVSAAEIQKRENLGYVSESPIEDNQCNNCNLYLPPQDKACGGCILFEGPVEAEGYCTYWAPKG